MGWYSNSIIANRLEKWQNQKDPKNGLEKRPRDQAVSVREGPRVPLRHQVEHPLERAKLPDVEPVQFPE